MPLKMKNIEIIIDNSFIKWNVFIVYTYDRYKILWIKKTKLI